MILKSISNFPGYSVSNMGWIESDYRYVVRTTKNGLVHPKEVKRRILKPHVSGNGYLFVTLRKGNKPYPVYIHRIVAQEYNVTRNDIATITRVIKLTGTELEIK